MTNNFFKLMQKLDSDFLRKETVLSDEFKFVIRGLIKFVEDCSWSNSEITKLYCRNWGSSYDQLRRIFKSNGMKDKSEITLRTQISEISHNLCSMFGSCDDIYNSFLAVIGRASSKTESEGKAFIRNLSLKLNALCSFGFDDFISRLAVNPHDLAVIDYTENCYKVSDCKKELELLKFLSSETMQSAVEGVDLDKLAFLLQVLNKPILVTERQERLKANGDSYKVNRLSVNTEKIDILSEFSLVKPLKVKSVSFEKSDIEDSKVSSDEVCDSESYNFSSMSELIEVIDEKANNSMELSDNAAKNIARAGKLFSLFTKEGLSQYLNSFSDGEIAQALDKYRK